jgi:hypothetical protein
LKFFITDKLFIHLKLSNRKRSLLQRSSTLLVRKSQLLTKFFFFLLNFFLSPNGYTCDVKAGRCNKGEVSIPFYLKTEAKTIEKSIEDVPCPGGSASCPDGSTCCQLASGQYGW